MKIKILFFLVPLITVFSMSPAAKPKEKDPYYCASDQYIIECSTNGGYVACDIIPGKPVCCNKKGDCKEDPGKIKTRLLNDRKALPGSLEKAR